MPLPLRISPRNVFSFGCALLLSAAFAHAQSDVANQATTAKGWSSSQSGTMQIAESSAPALSALPSEPAPAGAAAAQQDKNSNPYSGQGVLHRLTFEVGAGASAPAGDKKSITWGSGFQFGGGVNFTQHFATLIEYQFLNNKIPGSIISQSGATGGKYHIWSLTIDPVYDLMPTNSNDVYITGGGGFYRKTTNFTDITPQQFCTYFYYCGVGYAPSVVGKLSSNQGGFNIGAGYQHRFTGLYGEGHTRIFAEVRYVDVLSPAAQGKTPSGGLSPVTIPADTKLLPIIFGVRW